MLLFFIGIYLVVGLKVGLVSSIGPLLSIHHNPLNQLFELDMFINTVPCF